MHWSGSLPPHIFSLSRCGGRGLKKQLCRPLHRVGWVGKSKVWWWWALEPKWPTAHHHPCSAAMSCTYYTPRAPFICFTTWHRPTLPPKNTHSFAVLVDPVHWSGSLPPHIFSLSRCGGEGPQETTLPPFSTSLLLRGLPALTLQA